MPIIHDFEYFKPTTLNEALTLLNNQNNAKILSGGTDLIVQLKEEVVTPDYLIDIKGISEFNKITGQKDEIIIGAGITFSDIIKSELLKQKLPLLVQVSQKVASVGIRNRATLVGNICSAVPSLDSAPALLIYDAMVKVANINGSREISIHDWFVAPKKTALKQNELVTAIRIKIPQKKHLTLYDKLGRYRGEDLAQAGLGIYLEENNKFKLAFCAVGPVPKRLSKTEDYLNNTDNPDLNKAVEIMQTEISPITDIRSSEKYRRLMMGVMLKRGVEKFLSDFSKGGAI